MLDAEEIAVVTEIMISNMNISDLTGIEHFTVLEFLACDSNDLTSLDVSMNTALQYLYCFDNRLESLDVSENTALTDLSCYFNQLESLDLSKNTELTYLDCSYNPLWKLDLPENYSGMLNFTRETTLDISNFIITDGKSIDLSAYGLDAANFTYGTLDENGILTSEVLPGTVTYTYPLTNGDFLTIYIKFYVAINEENFPDETFRNYVKTNFDKMNNDMMDADEIAAVTEIDVSDMGISDLTGVEYFTALEYLYCNSNQLTDLDVSENTTLTYLDCYNNQLRELDLSQNTALQYLNCNSNQLTDLDVSENTALEYLYCNSNQLTDLDVSENTSLTYLDCGFNALPSLDVSENTALEYLSCDFNALTSLDVSGCTALTSLSCESNQLTSLDVSGCTALETLYCYGNQLTTLDLTKNTQLTYFSCNGNPLLAVNAVTGITDYYNASSLTAFTADHLLICLADYGILADRISNENGCSIQGEYLLLTRDGTSSYTYDVDGEHTIDCNIAFRIAIDEAHFPDDNFRTYVRDNLDDGDGTLTAAEIMNVTELRVVDKGITDLTGVEYFIGLIGLYCGYNELEKLDVTKNTALEYLDCNTNQLTSLDLTNNTELTDLYCFANQLTSLDVSGNTALKYLNCGSNQLTSLDVSENTVLKSLGCASNQLQTLDLTNHTELTDLFCYSNQLTSLDLTNNTDLKQLFCYDNPLLCVNAVPGTISYFSASSLQTFTADTLIIRLADYGILAQNISNKNGCFVKGEYLLLTGEGEASYIYDVDGEYTINCTIGFSIPIYEEHFPDDIFRDYVNDNFDTTDDDVLTADEIAVVTSMNVENMDISDLTGVEHFVFLTKLFCGNNQLERLDVSHNTALEYLYCNENRLTSLDVRRNTALTYLDCSSNQLTSLDVSKNTALTILYCYSNELRSLDVSQNTALTDLNCSSNQLTRLDMSNNTALTQLQCEVNQLTSLDVSGCIALSELFCYENQLTSLDVSKNTALTSLGCYQNSYEIDLIGGTFDLSTLPDGFDFAKASEWNNATVDGNILTVSDPNANITYVYDLGNSSTEVFTLKPVSCTLTTDMVQIEDQVYTGEEIDPIEIICGDYTLEKDTDYTVSYENNVNAGTATATITGKDFFIGEITKEFTIDPMDISNAEITLGEAMTYNGNEQTQEIESVVVGDITLTADDYIVTGNIGTDAISYTMTIEGKGNFTGTASVEWSIAKANPMITLTGLEQEYTGNPADVKADVTLVNGEVFEGTVYFYYIPEGEEYETYGLPTDAGTYTISASLDSTTEGLFEWDSVNYNRAQQKLN